MIVATWQYIVTAAAIFNMTTINLMTINGENN